MTWRKTAIVLGGGGLVALGIGAGWAMRTDTLTPAPSGPGAQRASTPSSRSAAPTLSADERFLKYTYDKAHLPITPDEALMDAHAICDYLITGHRHYSDLEVFDLELMPSPDFTSNQRNAVASGSVGVICPGFGYLLDRKHNSDDNAVS